MNAIHFIFFVAFLGILLNASAVVSDLPDSIVFFEEPKTLRFSVLNDSSEMHPLKIDVFSPVAYEIKGIKNLLEPEEEIFVELTFFPKNELVGSEYETTIAIELGKEKTEKKLLMAFYKRSSCPIEFSFKQKNEILEMNAKNNSLLPMEFSVKGIKEGNWKIEKKSFLIEANKEKKFELKVSGTKTGKNFILIECGGIENEIELSLQETNSDSIIGLTANAILSVVSEAFQPLNILLTVIAAILMVMFVSRLVKKTQEEKK
jgi:hypothetical protein